MLENDLLAKLPTLFKNDDPTVLIGSGPDDCAHVISPNPHLAFSTDAFTENTHFLATDPPEDIAHKTLTASLSDLAASGCKPLWALIALSLKKQAPENWAERFAKSIADTARKYNVSIIGGDVTSSPDATFIATTVAGTPLPGGPLLRSGAKPGDVIVVSGRLGGSLLGRHLRPIPRVREIAQLLNFCNSPQEGQEPLAPPNACMDISDGLTLDLSRMCRESNVGAVLEAEMIPVSQAAKTYADNAGGTPLQHALADGEDFELLLAIPNPTWQAFSRAQTALGCVDEETGGGLFTRIGGIVEKKGLSIVDERGAQHPLEPEGYQHQW